MFKCNKCQTNYALKRENNYECVLKTSIENDKHFYTNDSGITYYSCSLYNTISNCNECSSVINVKQIMHLKEKIIMNVY